MHTHTLHHIHAPLRGTLLPRSQCFCSHKTFRGRLRADSMQHRCALNVSWLKQRSTGRRRYRMCRRFSIAPFCLPSVTWRNSPRSAPLTQFVTIHSCRTLILCQRYTSDPHPWTMNHNVLFRSYLRPVLPTDSLKLSCNYHKIPSAKNLTRQPSPTGYTGSLQGVCAMRELPNKTSSGLERQTHLVIMANGLFGKSSNWDVIVEELRQTNLNLSHTLLVASNANSLTQVWTVLSNLVQCSLVTFS